VREECKRNRLIGKESDKVRRQNGWKGRVQGTNRMLERKEKNTEKMEREKCYQRNGYISEEVGRAKERWVKQS
jgi:hypothetical protein